MAIGLKQSTGSNIPGFTAPVPPDRNFSVQSTPNVRVTAFGDGYEQRKRVGINAIRNNFTINFINRPDTEIDDLVAFIEGLNGVDALMFTINDSNGSPATEKDLICVCDSWTESQPQEGIKSLAITLRRVYEP